MYTPMMFAVAIAATLATAPAAARPAGPHNAVLGGHRADTGMVCIRSGWFTASEIARRPIRRGDCRTSAEWRKLGIGFEVGRAIPSPTIRARIATADR